MTAILTLMFVRNPGEVPSPFLAPVGAAALRLLVEHRTEDIKALLSRAPVDAILLDQDHLQDSVVTEIKRIPPRTPLILMRCRSKLWAMNLPGVSFVCCADPEDEKVLNALPIFFAFILGKLVLPFRNH